jgi:cytochrome c oxidase subunit 1
MANGVAAETVEETELPNYFHEKSRYSGIWKYLFSTDHKKVCLLYLSAMIGFFLCGVGFATLLRLELMAPGMDFIGASTYNAVYTLHGIFMIFLFVIPGLPAVFGNFCMPIMIGAEDVSFPKLNLLSWYLFMTGAILIILSLFIAGGAPDTGWTFYAPWSIKTSTNIPMAVLGVFFVGFSSILTGLNFVTTIHRLRAPGVTFGKLPLFVWGIYTTGWLQILATPVIGITLLMVFMERMFGFGFFDPANGGDPVMYQHLFWIYSHPAVYIMILPAMGAISDIIPTFCKKPIFGYKSMAGALVSIGLIAYVVWGHHMFTSGMSDTSRIIFSFLTFFVGVPTAIKVFNWVATLHKGAISFSSPMLYAMAFVFLFSIGGLSGVINGVLAVDLHIHDTYFIVAHIHYVVFGGTGFGFFAAIHYWFPKMFGRMYSEVIAKWALGLFFVGFNVLYFPMFIYGYMGNPRRYYDYPPRFEFWQFVSTVGSWIMVPGILLMLANLVWGIFKGKKAPANPWGGVTLEWTVPSPPPLLNFDGIPNVTRGPYDYKVDEPK